jgi:hypothetical protein
LLLAARDNFYYGDWDMNIKKIIMIAFLVVMNAEHVYAASQYVGVHMLFANALNITNVAPISFGTLLAGHAGTFVLSSQGVVTGTDQNAILGGATAAGSMTISGSPTQSISISAANYSSDNGVTPSEATCSYDGGSESLCDLEGLVPPSSGKVLLLGVKIDVDGSQAIGTSAEPSFDVVVNYQ